MGFHCKTATAPGLGLARIAVAGAFLAGLSSPAAAIPFGTTYTWYGPDNFEHHFVFSEGCAPGKAYHLDIYLQSGSLTGGCVDPVSNALILIYTPWGPILIEDPGSGPINVPGGESGETQGDDGEIVEGGSGSNAPESPDPGEQNASDGGSTGSSGNGGGGNENGGGGSYPSDDPAPEGKDVAGGSSNGGSGEGGETGNGNNSSDPSDTPPSGGEEIIGGVPGDGGGAPGDGGGGIVLDDTGPGYDGDGTGGFGNTGNPDLPPPTEGSSATRIPEPGTLTMFGVGLLAAFRSVRRRRSNARVPNPAPGRRAPR